MSAGPRGRADQLSKDKSSWAPIDCLLARAYAERYEECVDR